MIRWRKGVRGVSVDDKGWQPIFIKDVASEEAISDLFQELQFATEP